MRYSVEFKVYFSVQDARWDNLSFLVNPLPQIHFEPRRLRVPVALPIPAHALSGYEEKHLNFERRAKLH